LPAEQKLVTDQAQVAEVERGPDIHCPYCGTRNPAGATYCSQCGGPLQGGRARQAGQVLGAYSDQKAPDIACPFCGTLNPASAVKCQKCGGALKKAPAPGPKAPVPSGCGRRWWIAAAVLALVIIAGIGLVTVLSARTTDVVGMVQAVTWERSIPVMEQRPVEYSDWKDKVPAGAQDITCEKKVRSVQSQPAAGAEEVCGTPYVKDTGSGKGKVVQDCEYRIYDQWCRYSRLEWKEVNRIVARGADLNPQWPDVTLGAGQREGDARAEQYTVTFKVEDQNKAYQYSLNEPADFVQFAPGSRWTLKVNTFGAVTGVAPAR